MTTQRGVSNTIALIIVAAILLTAGILAFTNRGRVTNTNTTNIENTNTATVQNTNTQSVNTNATVNVNAVANTNSSTNTNTGTNTNSSTTTLTVAQVIDRADEYDGQYLCVRGLYQSSFEFTAMSATSRNVNGSTVLESPYLWVETGVNESNLTCTTSGVGQKTCQGTITTCGSFRFAASGEPGFGQVNAYRYALMGQATTNTNNQLNAATGY